MNILYYAKSLVGLKPVKVPSVEDAEAFHAQCAKHYEKIKCKISGHSRTFTGRRGKEYWSDCMTCGDPGYVIEVEE